MNSFPIFISLKGKRSTVGFLIPVRRKGIGLIFLNGKADIASLLFGGEARLLMSTFVAIVILLRMGFKNKWKDKYNFKILSKSFSVKNHHQCYRCYIKKKIISFVFKGLIILKKWIPCMRLWSLHYQQYFPQVLSDRWPEQKVKVKRNSGCHWNFWNRVWSSNLITTFLLTFFQYSNPN